MFEEDGYRAGKNITRRQVWNNYPNGTAPWREWDSDLYLNQFKWFKLPVPAWVMEDVNADARYLIPKDTGGGRNTASGGTKVIENTPAKGFEEKPVVSNPIVVILLFMVAVAAFCWRRSEEEMDAEDERYGGRP